MKIHLATDHAGLDLKNSIREYLINQGYDVKDHGAYEYDALDDYPDFIIPCAKAVSKDLNSRGIIFGGSGQGEAMVQIELKEFVQPFFTTVLMKLYGCLDNTTMPIFFQLAHDL